MYWAHANYPRPEEVGEWWLPRRKGFNVHTWRAKCRCGHGHDEHDPGTRRCRCGCPVFTSNFACLVGAGATKTQTPQRR